jgi:negative regulator of sigma E activity
MTNDAFEVLSAFVDGEAVAPEALAEALAQPGSQAALVDFARLRTAMADDDSRPSAAFYQVADARLAESAFDRPPKTGPWVKRLCAAAVVAMAVVGAASLMGLMPAESGPPRPQKVLTFHAGVDWHEEAQRAGDPR